MDIQSNNPIVIPAKPQQVFDLWRIPQLMVHWPRPEFPMMLEANFRSCLRNENDQLIDGETIKTYSVPDLWALAATDPQVAQVMNSLIAVLTAKAQEGGVI
jgi:hypothetical protein